MRQKRRLKNRSDKSYFNPRTHEECDADRYLKVRFNGISIHALTRSATNPNGSSTKSVQSFQSTHSRGVRHQGQAQGMAGRGFQSTHSRGVRLSSSRESLWMVIFQSTHSRGVRHVIEWRLRQTDINFNPRTHEECDGEL